MTSLRTLQLFGAVAFCCGIAASFFPKKLPNRGWVGIVLVLLTGSAWVFTESGEGSRPSSVTLFAVFLLLAPFAVAYSFRAKLRAPDRIAANAAFFGGTIVAICLVFTLAGIIASLFKL